MSLVTLCGLAVAFSYAVVRHGGVDDWNSVLLVIGILGCFHFLWRFRQRVPRLDWVSGVSLLVFLFLAALQVLPLPVDLVRLISPTRLELGDAVLPLTGHAPHFVVLSAAPHNTWNELLTIAAYVLVFWLVRDSGFRLSSRSWATALPLLVVAGFEAALGFYQGYIGGAAGRSMGTYANPDHYAALLEMALPFAAVYACSILQGNRDDESSSTLPAVKATLLIGLGALMLVAITFSLSRMGFLSALASLIVAGVMIIVVRVRRVEYSGSVPWWRKWLAPVAVVATVALIVFLIPTNALLARFSQLPGTGDGAAEVRVRIWRDSIRLVKDYPLLGCGLGAYGSCFLRYKTAAPTFTVDYTHNDYLQILAEAGICGLAAGLLFLIRLIQRTIRGCFYARSVSERNFAIACVASMCAALLHSFVEFNMYVPANGMAFAWIAGMAGIHLRRSGKV
jgi:O-antigen ligase